MLKWPWAWASASAEAGEVRWEMACSLGQVEWEVGWAGRGPRGLQLEGGLFNIFY